MFDCQVFFPAHSHVDKHCINFLFLSSYLMHFRVKIDNSNAFLHHIKLYDNHPIKYMYYELTIPSGIVVCLLSTLYKQPDIVTEHEKNEL